MTNTAILIPPQNRLASIAYHCVGIHTKNAIIFFKKIAAKFIGFVLFLLLSTASSADSQKTLLFECNENSSTIGFSESRADFKHKKYDDWIAESVDKKYRVWSVPKYENDRTYEWMCKINFKDASIKIWSKKTPKNELMDKYDNNYEGCGEFRILNFTYDNKVILKDIIMEADSCDKNTPPILKTLSFSVNEYENTQQNSDSKSSFYLNGTGISKNLITYDYAILINSDVTSYGIRDRSKPTKPRKANFYKLPITSDLFNQFLHIKY